MVRIQVKIDDLKGNIRKHEDEIRNLDENHSKKNEEKVVLVEEFKEQCWTLKKEIDAEFKDLIEGYRNSRGRFMIKCLEESVNTNRELKSIDYRTIKKRIFI